MRSKFGLVGSLTSAAKVAGTWANANLVLNVIDKDGAYLVSDAKVGDVVELFIGDLTPGATASYRITAVNPTSGGTTLKATVQYAGSDAAPDLDWVVGTSASVYRYVNGVPGILSPGSQSTSDRMAFAAINRAMDNLANPQGVSGVTWDGQSRVTGFTKGLDTFTVTYGTDGVSTIQRNGSLYCTVTYTGGKLTSVTYA